MKVTDEGNISLAGRTDELKILSVQLSRDRTTVEVIASDQDGLRTKVILGRDEARRLADDLLSPIEQDPDITDSQELREKMRSLQGRGIPAKRHDGD